MPTLKNAKHERFAQEIAAGKSLAEAHGLAGYKAERRNAANLRSRDDISCRINELLDERAKSQAKVTEQAIKRAGISKRWVIERLVEITNRCMEHTVVCNPETGEPIMVEGPNGEVAAMCSFKAKEATRAAELLGKELGMFIDRKELRRVDEFEDMHPEDLKAYIIDGVQADDAAIDDDPDATRH